MNKDSLERFLRPQETMYETALEELEDGCKMSHWMWYIFPQLRGLGKSPMAWMYGIADEAEARAYLAHPVLGLRLKECCKAILRHEDQSAEDILGSIDAMKLRSCATLFAALSEEGSLFHQILDCFYNGTPDPLTLELL